MEATATTNTENLIPKWNRSAKASDKESQQFWSKLRHFYRTGELPKQQEATHKSALINVLKQKVSVSDVVSKDKFYPLLHQVLQDHQIESRTQFKAQLADLIHGLQDLLQIKENPDNDLKKTYDFAEELIAFDKLVNMIPGSTRQSLSRQRLSRLKEVATTLQEGLKQYNQQEATFISSTTIGKQLTSETIKWLKADSDPFKQLFDLFRKEIRLFTLLIKGYRIAKLETEDAYQENIHDQYFDGFTWHRLQKNELELFPPMVLIVDHNQVFDKLASFLKVINSNFPINIVVMNREVVSQPNKELSWEEAAHQNRQELAALSIAQRNVYTFQTGVHNEEDLINGLKEGFAISSPSVFNLSLPEIENQDEYNTVVVAENIGRYFPAITFNPGSITFDRSLNIDPDELWPAFTFEATTNEETNVIFDTKFTYADYKAIFSEKASELMVIPASYYEDQYLLPLADYLQMEEEQLYGKIPYIWLVSDSMELVRAAVPNVWVVSCQERQHYWEYLNRLGNITAKTEQETTAPPVKQTAPATLPPQEAVDQEQAIAVATQRLIAALLSEEK